MAYYVILDSGHNEYVSGKRSPNGTLKEWQWNNNVQVKLKKRLEEHGIIVYQTNPSPSGKNEIGLTKRCTLANDKYRAWGRPSNCLFVSIHGNASGVNKDNSGWCSPRGVEVFVANNASTKSRNAASHICSCLYSDIYALDNGFKNRGVKTENFTVIYNTIMPCLLIEHAFYDNYKDYILMLNKIDAFVEADVKGICKHFGIIYKAPIITVPKPPTTSTSFVVRVTTDSLNVRKGASTSYPIVTTVHKGDAFTIVEVNGSWGLLKSYSSARNGWVNISSSYVQKI